jgi:hypothetical protein
MSYTDPAASDPKPDAAASRGRLYILPAALAVGATVLVVAGIMVAVTHRQPTPVSNDKPVGTPIVVSASPRSTNSEKSLGDQPLPTGWSRGELQANGATMVFFYQSPLTESTATVLVNEAVAKGSWSDLPTQLVVGERIDKTEPETAKSYIRYAGLVITDVAKASQEVPKDLQIITGLTSTTLVQPSLNGSRLATVVIQSTFPNQAHRLHLAAGVDISSGSPLVKLVQSL